MKVFEKRRPWKAHEHWPRGKTYDDSESCEFEIHAHVSVPCPIQCKKRKYFVLAFVKILFIEGMYQAPHTHPRTQTSTRPWPHGQGLSRWLPLHIFASIKGTGKERGEDSENFPSRDGACIKSIFMAQMMPPYDEKQAHFGKHDVRKIIEVFPAINLP